MGFIRTIVIIKYTIQCIHYPNKKNREILTLVLTEFQILVNNNEQINFRTQNRMMFVAI